MRYRTCWISDLHLGSKKCQAEILLHFLENNQFDVLYLLGDIIDIWRWQRSGLLSSSDSQIHVQVIQKLLQLSNQGTKVYYIIGNHDEFLNNFSGHVQNFGNISFADHLVHTTVDGKSFLLLHGHQFDIIIRTNPWLAKLGDRGYEIMISINRIYNWVRRKLGMRYWSLSKYVKVKVKKAASFIENFEQVVSAYAHEKKCNGVIVGHIHHPDDRMLNGVRYINSGCWTDIINCNAVVERDSGEIEVIRWTVDGEQSVAGLSH